MTTQLAHPALGNIIGLNHEEVIQYRGIKYALLDHQFAEPILFTNLGQSTINATSFGPACIHNPAACDMEHDFIQHALPRGEFQFSGTDCLNLNIVTPKNVQYPVPVFVFIHGGGFSIGANSWPQYDPTRLVEFSIKKGSPVIGININYRLGVPGFLASQELLSAGIKSNNGLRDQRAALTWIRTYIEGFGGDLNNITVAGESAGAISCFFHLESQQPLFKRMLSMGGTPLLLKPIPPQAAESMYTVVLEKLGLSALSPKERIKALKEVTMEDLVAATSNLPLLPVIDGELITTPATFSQWSFQENRFLDTEWCESIMIGDCEMDSSILFYMLHDRIEGMEGAFITSTERSLGKNSPTQQQLLEEYHIGGNQNTKHSADTAAVDNVLHFAHDIGFYAPVASIASGWPGKSYVYHFNEPNPWHGRFQGVATHILDAAFLFQNYNEYLDESQRSSAKAFGRHFIDFVVGSEPFPSYLAGKGGAMVYGPGGDKRQEYVRSNRSEDYKRRSAIFKLAETCSLEKLSGAWDAFMRGQ